MKLGELLRNYCLERDLRPGTIVEYQNGVRQFVAFAGDKELGQITADDLNLWAEHQVGEAHLSKRTVRNKVCNVLTLLRAAVDRGLMVPLIGRVRRVKVPANVVEGFRPEDVLRLLTHAEKLVGYFYRTGLSRKLYFKAFINCAWDTALRASDLLELRFRDVREHPNGAVVIQKVQRKTGRVIVVRISGATWLAIKELHYRRDAKPDDLVFPLEARRPRFYQQFRELCQSAGLHGTAKYLRRGRATAEYKLRGLEAASRVLGHADGTGALAWKNYIDRSQLDDELPLPPPIG